MSLGVGFLGIVEGFVLVTDKRHLRVVRFLMGDATIDPLVVCLRCQRSDEDGVLTLTAHALGHLLHQISSEVLILEGLDVVVDILLACCFMRDHSNALVHGALQHRLKCLRRHRHDGERINALCNHVFNESGLLLGIGLCRANLECVYIIVLCVLIDAFLHAVEPLDTRNLNNSSDGSVGSLHE